MARPRVLVNDELLLGLFKQRLTLKVLVEKYNEWASASNTGKLTLYKAWAKRKEYLRGLNHG